MKMPSRSLPSVICLRGTCARQPFQQLGVDESYACAAGNHEERSTAPIPPPRNPLSHHGSSLRYTTKQESPSLRMRGQIDQRLYVEMGMLNQ